MSSFVAISFAGKLKPMVEGYAVRMAEHTPDGWLSPERMQLNPIRGEYLCGGIPGNERLKSVDSQGAPRAVHLYRAPRHRTDAHSYCSGNERSQS
jgi:hypothetical protein